LNCSNCNHSYDNKSNYLCPSCGNAENVNVFSEIPIYLDFLKNLINKASTIIAKLESKNIPRDDIRRTKLGAFTAITLATLFDLNE